MDYISIGKIPPKKKDLLSAPEDIALRLNGLIGTEFKLSGKPRTDGSAFRKLITDYLLGEYQKPPMIIKSYLLSRKVFRLF